MLGDGAISSTIASWWGKVRPQGARRDRAPANDAMFIDVMADFSRKLGERVARQTASGLAAVQQERREFAITLRTPEAAPPAGRRADHSHGEMRR